MILDREIEIYNRQEIPSAKGINSYTYSLFLRTKGGIQPQSLNQTQLAQWGLTDTAANAKRLGIREKITVTEGSLVKDLKTTERYEVRACNNWLLHTRLLLVPYQGGAPI